MMIRIYRVSSFVAAIAVLAAVSGTANAQTVTKPFKIDGLGIAPTGLPLPGEGIGAHWIVGDATHLGAHYGEGAVQTDSADFNPEAGTFTGEFGSGAPFVFTGANGDKLACHYGRTAHGASTPGTFTLTILGFTESGVPIVEAEWIAEFVPFAPLCTGKFTGSTGGWVMYAYSEPFVLGSTDPVIYGWSGRGSLTFKK